MPATAAGSKANIDVTRNVNDETCSATFVANENFSPCWPTGEIPNLNFGQHRRLRGYPDVARRR
ncbi:hypothetical protein [Mycobacterium simiae]|uniref:Uncharacterized protein n=1 Tax=Mycobacterium simiae TaxID=1784 RepID=A0A1X0XIA0_MYCSI|nr:hypothetical protein [Mycobacterium simiae]ORJ52615.1 hypothetical protein B5M45_30990 [Mycobacterium simiae]